MKTAAALLLLVAVGCSSTSFTEFRGPEVMQGEGGTVRVVDGIEFWESGTPNRKFKILGVLDHSRLHYVVALGSKDGAIAKAAKERGADAVVLGPQVSDMMLVNRNSGYVVSEQHTKAALIKYLP